MKRLLLVCGVFIGLFFFSVIEVQSEMIPLQVIKLSFDAPQLLLAASEGEGLVSDDPIPRKMIAISRDEPFGLPAYPDVNTDGCQVICDAGVSQEPASSISPTKDYFRDDKFLDRMYQLNLEVEKHLSTLGLPPAPPTPY